MLKFIQSCEKICCEFYKLFSNEIFIQWFLKFIKGDYESEYEEGVNEQGEDNFNYEYEENDNENNPSKNRCPICRSEPRRAR